MCFTPRLMRNSSHSSAIGARRRSAFLPEFRYQSPCSLGNAPKASGGSLVVVMSSSPVGIKHGVSHWVLFQVKQAYWGGQVVIPGGVVAGEEMGWTRKDMGGRLGLGACSLGCPSVSEGYCGGVLMWLAGSLRTPDQGTRCWDL